MKKITNNTKSNSTLEEVSVTSSSLGSTTSVGNSASVSTVDKVAGNVTVGRAEYSGVDDVLVGTESVVDDRVATIPVASSTTLGAVKPVSKSSGMTQPVGVDSNGRLFTSPTDISSKQDKDTAVTHEENTAVGDSNRPVYIDSNGAAKAIKYTIDTNVPADAKFTDTTYRILGPREGGSAESLVSTGEKYKWNNKQDALISGENIKTINNQSILGQGNIEIDATTDYDELSNKPKINGITLEDDKTGADLKIIEANPTSTDEPEDLSTAIINGKLYKFANGSVTGVKGNAESTYHTGNVNLTPENLGLSSKNAEKDGTDISLVTTGEKYTWDNKQEAITSDNKLSSDLVTDVNQTNKFVTDSDKTKWNSKQDAITDSSKLSADLIQNGTTNKVVTQTEKDTWNAKQSAITETNKLSADLIIDGTTNKTVTQTEKNTWSGKQDKLDQGNGITIDSSNTISVNIYDGVDSTSLAYALSANQGKVLQDEIDTLKARGRFLSVWNSSTGKPTTEPTTKPYEYKTGDYYVIGYTGTTNYKPTGKSYTGEASTVVESNAVSVNDMYYYDGSAWTLFHTAQPTVSFSALAGSPNDNANLKSALDAKQDNLIQGEGISIATDKKTISAAVKDVQVNNKSVVTNKVASITVPTKTSDLTNDDNTVKDANYSHITVASTGVSDANGNSYSYSLPSDIKAVSANPASTTATLEGITIGDTSYAVKDTTYSSKDAVKDGTDVSLVTTGEKYTWNSKSVVSAATPTSESSEITGLNINGTTYKLAGSEGSSTDVQINSTSITSSGVANIITNTAYNKDSNKIATMSDVGTKVEANPTSTTGTLTGIKIGDTSYALSNSSITDVAYDSTNKKLTKTVPDGTGTKTVDVVTVSTLKSAMNLSKSDVGLSSVVNTGDSATPTQGGTTKFTTGGAYTELAKKVTANTAITGGTNTKITYDSKGLVTKGESLTESDIPSLSASKITSGTFADARISSASTWNSKSKVSVSATGTSTDKVNYITVDNTEYKLDVDDPTENTVTLDNDLYAYTSIGKITGASATNPILVASAGKTLKDVFNKILGEETDNNPTISQNGTALTKTGQTGTTSASGSEYGTSIASQTGTVTWTVTNTATCSYGLKAGDYDTYNKKSSTTFNYPIKTRSVTVDSVDYSYQIAITYPTLNGCTLSVTTGTLVKDDTTNRVLYCNLSADNKVTVSISIPSTKSTTSAFTRFGTMTANVEYNNAQYNGVDVENFWTYLKKSYTSSGITAPTQKTSTSDSYSVTAGSYYPYYMQSANSTVGSTLSGCTKTTDSAAYSDGATYTISNTYFWFVIPSAKTYSVIQQYVTGQWNNMNTTNLGTTTLTLNTGATATYKVYRTDALVASSVLKLRINS